MMPQLVVESWYVHVCTSNQHVQRGLVVVVQVVVTEGGGGSDPEPQLELEPLNKSINT